MTLTANAGNINLTNFTARAGNEIIVTATGNNEVVIGPNSHLFIRACNHPGNSFRDQNHNSRGDVTPYAASIAPPNNNEEKKIYESENVKYTFYPNPFTDHLHIDFLLQKPSDVKVSIYNSFGQIVETLAQGKYEAGEYTLFFDNSFLTPGVYFVKLDLEDRHYTEAVVKTSSAQ